METKQRNVTTLMNHANQLGRIVISSPLSHPRTAIFSSCTVHPKLDYPLVATYPSYVEIKRFQSKIHSLAI